MTISTNHFTLFGVLAAVDPATSDDGGGSDDSFDDATSATTSSDAGATVPRDRGVVLSRINDQVTVMIGAGALAYDADVDIYTYQKDFQKPTPPLWLASDPYRFRLIARYNAQDFHQLEDSITLVLGYDPTALGGIPENSLRINYYDTAKKRWYPLSSVLITDRHEVATVLTKIHGIYALVGGFGYQGVPYFADSTVTVASSSEELGIDQDILPTQEEATTSDTVEVVTGVLAKTERAVSESESVSSKPGFFARIINFVKNIFGK